ncbi:Ankyrin repeat and KH domain-containing protein mask [Gryllus bimaculatus]|nr:Ankyrin repeat and KH domain-containing protein mask [Gryllus bimaculatus]
MEVLLGLTSPSLWTIEQQLPEVPQEETTSPVSLEFIQDDALNKAVEVFEDTLQRTHKKHSVRNNTDFTDGFGDGAFRDRTYGRRTPAEMADSESTMLRSTSATDETAETKRRHLGVSADKDSQSEPLDSSRDAEMNDSSTHQDFDVVSVGSATSGVSTLQIHPELQNIREQMAVSLERMRELEEQVKLIPILQIQLAVLKEEKRKLLLQQKVQANGDRANFAKLEVNVASDIDSVSLHKNEEQNHEETSYRGDGLKKNDVLHVSPDSWSKNSTFLGNALEQTYVPNSSIERKVKTSFRNRGITCSVVTRDVGVSHLQPKMRNVGTNTQEPHKKLTFSGMRRENILPDVTLENANRLDRKELVQPIQQSCYELKHELRNPSQLLPDLASTQIHTKSVSVSTDLQMSDIQQYIIKSANVLDRYTKNKPTLINIASQTINVVQPLLRITEHSDFAAQVSHEQFPVQKEQKEIHYVNAAVQCDFKVMKHVAVQQDSSIWQNTCGIQYEPLHWSRDAIIQVGEFEKHVTDVGVTVKPQIVDCGVEAKIITRDKGTLVSTINEISCDKCKVPRCNVAVGTSTPANEKVSMVSLSSLYESSNSHLFSLSEQKAKTTVSVACGVDFKFSTSRSTDTNDLVTIITREAGINTINKQFRDAAVCHSQERLKTELNGDLNIRTNETCIVKDIVTNESVHISQSRIPRLTGPVSPTAPSPIITKTGTTVSVTAEKLQKPSSPVPQTNIPKSPSTSVPKAYARKQSTVTSTTQETKNTTESRSYHRLQRQETYTKLPEVTVSQLEEVENTRENRVEPSKEMKAALKVINDYFKKNPSKKELPKNLTNATNIVQQEWFKVSGGKSVNPLAVEDYLDYIEGCSSALLEFVVNMTDISGNTALHYAVSSGNFDVVSILLDSKVCNVNKRNAAGYTCVMLATLVKLRCETHKQIIRRMFHLADVNIKAKPHGQTALMLATSHGSLEMVEMLTEAGADMNIQDADGSTALMCAADHGFIDIVKHIIAQPDCDVTLTDSDGCTALNIAMESGNRHVGFLLYAHEHFSQGSSPHGSLRSKHSRSSTPTSRSNISSGHPTGTPVSSDLDKNQS